MWNGKKLIAGLLAFGMVMQSVSVAVPTVVKAEQTSETDGEASDLVFHDFEGDTLVSNDSGSLTTEQVYEGQQALKYDKTESGGDVNISAKSGSAINISEQNYITFWVWDSGSNNLAVKLIDKNGKETEVWTSDETKSKPGEWSFMSVALSEYVTSDFDWTQVEKVAFYEWNDGVYYIDDVRFVKELPPAVDTPAEEDHPMDGTATWFQNFEGDDADISYETAPVGATAKIAAAGCEKDGAATAGLVYEKAESASPEVDDGSVVIKSAQPVDTTGLRYLIFYIRDMQGSNTLKVSLIDADGKETDFGAGGWCDVRTSKEKWVQYYVMLDGRAGEIDRTRISGIRLGQWNQGTYYIDNVYFDNYLYTGTPDSGISLPQVESGKVAASVEPGKYTEGQTVELVAEPGAYIYYTTDGSEPRRVKECQYNGAVNISGTRTIKAFAVKDDKVGDVCVFEYHIVPYPVTATSVPGTYKEQAVVEFRTKNNGDLIYYTTDGTDPVRGASNTMQYIKPMLVTENTVFKAIAYDSSTGEANEVTELSYVIEKSGELKAPAASRLAGTYGGTIEVALSADGDIYYTTDGSEPTVSATKYDKPITVANDVTVKAVAVRDDKTSAVAVYEYKIDKHVTPFLKVDGKVLKDNFGTGDVVTLRGTNAGGWLVTEDWQCPTNAKDQLTAQKVFTERFGAETAKELIELYQNGWWTEKDFDMVQAEGMNVLRLPVTHFEMLNADGSLKETAFDRMQWFIENCEKRGMYVMIDMHGAVGSQNGKDHSGDVTIPDVGNFYDNEENIAKTIRLWEAIAEKYKDNPWVCGYDLLNEPSAVGTKQFEMYDMLYDAIRAIDKNHVLYMQAIWEPTHLPDPDFYGWQNVAYEYHFYGWHVEKDSEGQKEFIRSKVKMANEDTGYNLPLFVGEFSFFSNLDSWKAMDIFEEQGWSYTTWTWKVTGDNSSWGIYTSDHARVDIYNDSEETIRQKWAADKLNTDSAAFKRNDPIADILKGYFAKNVPAKPAPDTEEPDKNPGTGTGAGNGAGSSSGSGTGVSTGSGTNQTPSVDNQTKPEDKPETDDTVTPGDEPSGDTSTENGTEQTKPAPAKGDKITASNGTAYVVTKSANNSKAPTVKYCGPKKSVSTVKIPATVKIDGITYKVTAIAANACKGDRKITKLTVGDNITSIGKNAFNGCKNLKSVTIGKNVKTIGAGAFANDKKLKTIVIRSTKLTAKSFGKNVFAHTDKNLVIKVPASKLKVYKKYLKAAGCKAKVTKIK